MPIPFPPDYFSSRDAFRTAAHALGWSLQSWPIDATGPKGEPLSIDAAASDAAVSDAAASDGDPKQTLLVTSGLHGVEGFFGAAVQLAAMQQWRQQEPAQRHAGVRCVFLHGLNPYGFAHIRRFDENNVDPNRNFKRDGKFSGSPEFYDEIDSFLNPQAPPSFWHPFLPRAIWTILRHGTAKLRQDIASGQYEYPRGLFFGGKQPTQSHRILAEQLPTLLAGSEQILHLDMHTGLGKFGTYKLLIDYPSTKEQEQRLIDYFGEPFVQTCDVTDIAYQSNGVWGAWCMAQGLAPDYLYACAEFGTYGGISVLSGLRTENQAHHWAKPEDACTIRAKERLKELFCPASKRWRTQVIEQSMTLIQQALAGLRSTS